MYKGERFNSITHLVGAVLALAGGSVLVVSAVMSGDALRIVGHAVYVFTLLLLYTISTLYHSLAGPSKRVFRILDHQAIYLLIAGTYTPFILVALEGSLRWWMLGTIWGLAVLGMVWDALPTKGPRIVSVLLYLLMGWLCVFTLDPIVAAMSPGGFELLVAGGVFYTLGIVFFALDRWRHWCHGVWHLFVIGGSASHYFSVALLR